MASKKTFLDNVSSLYALEEWAKANSCANDPDVNLKRMELLAKGINSGKDQPDSRKSYKCDLCDRSFSQNHDLLRHARTVHGNKRFQCEQCLHTFSRHDNYMKHNCRQSIKRKSSQTMFEAKRPCLQPLSQVSSDNIPAARWATCNWCGHYRCLLPGKLFCQHCSTKGRECRLCHRPLPERFYSQQVDQCDSCVRRRERYQARRNQVGSGQVSALEGTVATTTLIPNDSNNVDILQFLADEHSSIQSILHEFLTEKKGMKWFLTLKLKFVKYDENNESVLAEPILRSTNFLTVNFSEMDEQIAEAYQKLYTASQEFQAEGSGWVLDHIIQLEVNTAEYAPLMGSSYVPLPKYLADKKAILNIQNKDQKCFIWSVLAALHPVSFKEHANRVSKYVQFEAELNIAGIDMPVPLSQISKFERLNQISLNVFGYDEQDGVFPLHISSFDFTPELDLLLLSHGDQRHFCLIRDFSRLMGNRTKHCRRTFYCRRCLHGFTRSDLLEDHKPYCSHHVIQKVRMPESDGERCVKFKSIQKQLKVPYVIYADFESVTEKVSTCQPNPQISNTTIYQKHEPSGFCYKVVSSNPNYHKAAVVYRGPNVISHFIDCLLNEEREIDKKLKDKKPMKLTDQDEMVFQLADTCHICHKELGSDKVRDHDHLLSGYNYRGPAHNNCNLQFQFKKNKGKKSYLNEYYIPVVFHNLRGYDSHLIMKQLDKAVQQKLQCLANNMEKYISFSVGSLRFIDSLQFLNASLDILVKNLNDESSGKFLNLRREFSGEQQFNLLLRKGVYPYDYMDDESKFDMTHLPSQENFYNVLKDDTISNPDYEHAQNVWSTFNLNTMGDYHDLYMKTDVLLLADVFENFRDTALKYYQLDPAHYYTLPGLGWDAMLKMGNVELELLTDLDMHLMIEDGLRGGISMISKKYARANFPGFKTLDYNTEEPISYLMYWDANNLYGWAMSQPLPERDFQWVSENDLDTLDIMNVDADADVGYILEVDLEYPQTLHDSHSDYPLAPESMAVSHDMLSPHSENLKKKLKIKGKPSKKLVPNLFNKERYVLHYRNLQFYVNQGMILTKIHRAIKFTQSPWLKPFIEFNTQKRKEAENETDKAFFKLLNNSCFGRSMMNVRKHVNVELVNSAKRLKKLCAKPTFEAFKIFNSDLAAVHLKKATLNLNQPIYAGFSILDLSKKHMYDFHYNFIKPKYGKKAQLCFTDTDSLCYHIETEDVYADMGDHIELFDTSNYPKTNPIYSVSNNKVLGKFKDEAEGCPMVSFCGLRPKLYSYDVEVPKKDDKTDDTQFIIDEEQKAKGISKTVIKRQLRHELYKHCLMKHTQFRHQMTQIQSRNHQLYTVKINKISLSPFDDKRYVLEDGINTLAHGHYRIKAE